MSAPSVTMAILLTATLCSLDAQLQLMLYESKPKVALLHI